MASDLIGKGVFATVRLENSADGSSVAVKVYEHRVGSPGSDLQRMHEMHLANEVRLAGRLAHPHIIAPQEVRVGGSRTELTMEYAPHGTLEAYALRLGPVGLPETDGRRLFSELVSAVQYLHGQGVAHRDVKLENVMLDVQWRARLIDFGSAHEVKPSIMATGHKALTTHAMQSLPQSPSPHHGAAAGAPGGGSVFNHHRFHWMQGTPGYMGPEVLQGALSGRGGYDLLPADVWSLGVCLYCLFNQTGLPFRGKDAHELLKNASSRPHPPLSHLSRNGTDLLNQLLAKSPNHRPSAKNISKHVWFNSPGSPASPHGPPLGFTSSKKGGFGVDAASVSAVAAGEAVWIVEKDDDDQPPPTSPTPYGMRGAHNALTRPATATSKALPSNQPQYKEMARAAAHGRVAHEGGLHATAEAARAAAAAYRAALPAHPPILAGTRAAAASIASRQNPVTQRPVGAAGGVLNPPPYTTRTDRPLTAGAFDGKAPPGFGLSAHAMQAGMRPGNPAEWRQGNPHPGDPRSKQSGGAAPQLQLRGATVSVGRASGPNADVPEEFCCSLSVRSFAQLGIK